MSDPEPLLPDATSDESDRGWGEDRTDRDGNSDAGSTEDDARDEWLRSQRPPHHGG